MMFRRLVAPLLLTIALAFAPLAMPAMAEAAAPAPHHGAMAAEGGHCDEQPQPDQQHKTADKGCCAAMCLGLAVPSGAAELNAYHGPSVRPAPDRFRLGFLGDIATPPPKRS